MWPRSPISATVEILLINSIGGTAKPQFASSPDHDPAVAFLFSPSISLLVHVHQPSIVTTIKRDSITTITGTITVKQPYRLTWPVKSGM